MMISPVDTFKGFRDLGFSFVNCVIAAIFINGFMSYPTGSSWVPDPLFRINLRNIHRAKHGSDSEAFDTDGRFVEFKFDEMFKKYGGGGTELNSTQIKNLLIGNRNTMDFAGWITAAFEFGFALLLVHRSGGKWAITKEELYQLYSGELFYKIAHENKQQKFAHKKVN